MKLIYSRLIKIDQISQEVSFEEFNGVENLNRYIMNMIGEIAENDGDRIYKFKDTFTTMQNYIQDFIEDKSRDEVANKIANRLLRIESDAQKSFGQFTSLQKGILLIAYCDMETTGLDYKLLISKADYNEFIEESTGELKNGLPTRRRVFKAYVANVKAYNGVFNIETNTTYDVNANMAKYWYDCFLELEPVVDNETNTQRAFDAIDKFLLAPLKKKSKSDYMHLRNATIHYMRSEGDFDISYYAETLIAGYVPLETGVDISVLVEKVKEFPKRYKFDKKFAKVPSAIKAKVKEIIRLTTNIDLVLKDYIPNIDHVILSQEVNGKKYIMIESEEGYKYASGRYEWSN